MLQRRRTWGLGIIYHKYIEKQKIGDDGIKNVIRKKDVKNIITI